MMTSTLLTSITAAMLLSLTLIMPVKTIAQDREIDTILESQLRRNYAVKTVVPEYPEKALKDGVQGLAVVNLEFNEKGDVTRVELNKSPIQRAAPTKGNPGFDGKRQLRGPFITDSVIIDAVISAVKQWKFKPLIGSDAPSAIRSELTFIFVIEDGVGRVEDGPQAASQPGIDFSDNEASRTNGSPP